MLRDMETSDLIDAQWERLCPLLPPRKSATGRPAKDHGTAINGLGRRIATRYEKRATN